MEEKEMIVIENPDGTSMEVELITYLISDDQVSSYLVYSKGEKSGINEDEVIYISKIVENGEIPKLEEITDDKEWAEVQQMLKKIANA